MNRVIDFESPYKYQKRGKKRKLYHEPGIIAIVHQRIPRYNYNTLY